MTFPRKAPKHDLVMSVRIREYLKRGEDLALAVILLAVCVLFDFVMQQIYTQSHEEFEVFTTVLSPQG